MAARPDQCGDRPARPRPRFWAACSVGLGASSGDAVWAVAVALGAGLLLDIASLRLAFSVASTALLLLLAALFLRGAARGFARARSDPRAKQTGRFESGRAGYLLGFGLALSSPWNVAFWLAVMGAPDTAQAGLVGALVVAAAVLLGTISWVLLLSGAVVLLRLRFSSAIWDSAAQGATGLLMLVFATRGLGRLLGF